MTYKLMPGRDLRMLPIIAAALLVMSLQLPAVAQTAAGTVTITVRDGSGAVVPGATVTLTNQATGQEVSSVTTNQDGAVVFSGLPPGMYTARVRAANFAVAVLRDINVSLSQAATTTITLQPSLLTVESVTVAEESRTRPEELLPRQELSSIPNLNNDLTPLLQIVPGAVATGPSSLGKIIIDGRGNDQQTVRLDGVDFTPQVDFPSADAAVNPVGSFQKPEVAGNLDASKTRSGAFGYPASAGPGSGIVSENVTYKAPFSGWAWQVYGEGRNDALNARNFFDYDGKNGVRRARFGGKFGGTFGPKQRDSLFLAYDGWRGRTESNVYEAVPADAMTGGAGPLAQIMRGFLPPGTRVVPGASLNPDFVVARRRTRTTVEANAFDARFDYFLFRPEKSERKCPYGASPKDCSVLTFRLTHQTAENHVPDGVTGRSQRQRITFSNGLVGWKRATQTKPINSEFANKRGPKEFGHQFRFGFNTARARVVAETLPSTAADLSQSLITTGGTVQVTGLPLNPLPAGVPVTVPVATLGGLVRGQGRGLDLRPTTYSASYDLSRLASGDKMHEMYAGFEARFIRFDYDRLGGLTYSFPSAAALRAGTPGSVTFLSDLSGPSPFSTGTGRRQARQQFYMGYFQMVSQFRAAKKDVNHELEPAITLTYGLRYDYFSRVRERDNRAVVVDPLTGQMLPPGSPFYRVDKINLQPRLGIAYRLGDGPAARNTVLRAGFGLYSGVPRIGDLTLPIDSDRFSTGVTGGTFPALASDLIRQFTDNPLTRQFQPLAFARDFSPLERSLKWDVKFGHTHDGYEFSAYYVGNVGRNLALANVANRIVSVATNLDPTRPAVVVRQFDVVRGGLVFEPFGEFFYRRGGGRSAYNALSLQVSRDADDQKNTPKRWLKIPVANFNAKYTLSHSVGNAGGTLMSNPDDPDADFGNNSGIPRHSFTLSAAYNLWQVAENRNAYSPLLGWKILPSLRVASGLPLNVRLARPDVVYVDAAGSVFASPAAGRTAVLNTPGGGSSGGAFFPSIVPGVSPFSNKGTELLNPAAFTVPAPGRLGNLRRGQLRGPSVVQFDLGLRRNLPFVNKEKTLAEFQIDIFNVFNHANFNNPTAVLPGLLGTSVADQLQPGAPFTRAAAGAFGIVTAADPGRLIQFTLTLKFNKGYTK
jgi:hypothetical protein